MKNQSFKINDSIQIETIEDGTLKIEIGEFAARYFSLKEFSELITQRPLTSKPKCCAKIVQMIYIPEEKHYLAAVALLFDDGSIWMKSRGIGKWEQMEVSIN